MIDNNYAFYISNTDKYINIVKHYTTALQLFVELANRANRSKTSYIRFYIEKVVDNDNVIVGYRIRLMHHDTFKLSELLLQLFDFNREQMKKKLNENNVKVNILEYQKLNEDRYKDMCAALFSISNDMSNNESMESPLEQSSIFYPTTLFTIASSCLHAYKIGAKDEQCEYKNYVLVDEYSPTIQLGLKPYQNINLVWNIAITSCTPFSLMRSEFPFNIRPAAVVNAERKLFSKLHDWSNLDQFSDNPALINYNNQIQRALQDGEQNRKRRKCTPEESNKLYDQHVNINITSDEELTFETLQMRAKLKLDEFNTIKKQILRDEEENMKTMSDKAFVQYKCKNSYRLSKLRKDNQLELLKLFCELWNEDAKIPLAHQNIAKYFKEWLATHNGKISLPRSKQINNLTPFHEIIAELAVQLEVSFGVNTGQLFFWVMQIDLKFVIQLLLLRLNCYLCCSIVTYFIQLSLISYDCHLFHIIVTYVIQLSFISHNELFKNSTAHREIVTVLLASFQVYWRTPFHCHCIFSGPPEAGKTFTLEQLTKILIPGTYEEYSYATPKAKTAGTNQHCCMIEVYEECPPSTLGIQTGHSSSKRDNATNNTDAESLLKTQLTTG